MDQNDPLLSEDILPDPNAKDFDYCVWAEVLRARRAGNSGDYHQDTLGLSFRHLSVHGHGLPTDYQRTFGNGFNLLRFLNRKKKRVKILQDCEGVLLGGEMLLVLGRPGSGCSTLLKTLAGETQGLSVGPTSQINYEGTAANLMGERFRGEALYQAEVDVHYPQLTVRETLNFVAKVRTPTNGYLRGMTTSEEYATHMTNVAMATFGIKHTMNTNVGDDLSRGVSGGERKRVSIAEAFLNSSPLQCWDHSTRGLDSATALKFIKTLRISTQLEGKTIAVASYQVSDSMYDMFDKVLVFYEGFEIYFGASEQAKIYFIKLGFECPSRQTTADFLTSVTSPGERRIRPGFEDIAPRSPPEFAHAWQSSLHRADLLRQITEFNNMNPSEPNHVDVTQKVASQRKASTTYMLSNTRQIRLCMRRGFQRLQRDLPRILVETIGNSIVALIVGTLFYNLEDTTRSLDARATLLFYAVILSAFGSVVEVMLVFAQRPITEKHMRYSLYRPYCEAIASFVCDLPNKIISCLSFSIVVYLVTGLRRNFRAFSLFYLFNIACSVSMSMVFRGLASFTTSMSQAMAPAATLVLALIMYSGFIVPIDYMYSWLGWLRFVNPIAYTFEALMINEFGGRQIECRNLFPHGSGYEHLNSSNRICVSPGSETGREHLNGDSYLQAAFGFEVTHLWWNMVYILVIGIAGFVVHLYTAEFTLLEPSKGEVLLFPQGKEPSYRFDTDEEHEEALRGVFELKKLRKGSKLRKNSEDAVEHSYPTSIADSSVMVPRTGLQFFHSERFAYKQTSPGRCFLGDLPSVKSSKHTTLHWSTVDYYIRCKDGQNRQLIHTSDGWIKPYTITALMGISGAGKTTLLDVLASRATLGVVNGKILVNGRKKEDDDSFQRKTGYAPQQDLHLATSTVREALIFSALLRQPASAPKEAKLELVEDVIEQLEMEIYADAVIGVPGVGLNVEQRKRLTIAVELVANPAILFLDEPTSGLDSQTAWSIMVLLKKLSSNGLAILCTIHQPSATLFEQFDRLLLLAEGGRTVYFGDIGPDSRTLISYFEEKGSRAYELHENPAEWMLEVMGVGQEEHNQTTDWPAEWTVSKEYQDIKDHLGNLAKSLLSIDTPTNFIASQFATPFHEQLKLSTVRMFQNYWRSPDYVYGKTVVSIASALLIGLSFMNTPNTMQGMHNQLYAIFMLLSTFSNVCHQLIPRFAFLHTLYEGRERPSNMYSWPVFLLSNMLTELPWNALLSILIFMAWYFPIGLQNNSIEAIGGSQFTERAMLMLLYISTLVTFTTSFCFMVACAIAKAEIAATIANLSFSICLIFSGVLVSSSGTPRFWIWLNRLSPMTYLVDGLLSVGLGNAAIECSIDELLPAQVPEGDTCASYLAAYIDTHGGYVTNGSEVSSSCLYCPMGNTNDFIGALSSDYTHRWRNLAILCLFIFVNTGGAFGFYWLLRVPRKKKWKLCLEA